MKRIQQLTGFFARHRLAIGICTVILTIAAAISLPSIKLDDNFNNLLKQSAQADGAGLETLSDDNACVVLIEGGRVLSKGNQDAIRSLVAELNDAPGVVATHSIFDARKPIRFGKFYLPLIVDSPNDEAELESLESKLLEHPLVQGKLLSADARATVIIAELDPALQTAREYQIVLNRLAGIVENELAGTPLRVGLTGIPALQVEMTETLKWEQAVFVTGAEIVGLLISLLLFRRWAAVVVVQAGPIAAVIWSMGTMALVGEPLNVINCILAPLVLTIAFTDSVHLVLRIRTNLEKGLPRVDAVMDAVQHVGPACFLTSLTTAIAFASLATADIEVIRRFGWSCAIAVVIAFFAVITVVPLLACSPFGESIRRRSNASAINHAAIALWFARFVTNLKLGLSISSLALTGILLVISTRLEPDIQMRQLLPRDGKASQALLRCDELFNGLLPVYVIIDWEKPIKQADLLSVVRAVDKIVAAEPLLGSSASVVGLLQSLSSSTGPVDDLKNLKYLPKDKLGRLISIQEHRTIVISRVRDIGTRNIQPLRLQLQKQFDALEAKYPHVQIHMSGWTVSAGRLSETMLKDMLRSLYSAVLISFLVLVVAFRSFWLGLVSLIPNLFPLAATAATMVLFEIPLHFSSATVFSVCFGIAVDDTIHFLWAYTHECGSGANGSTAIRRTLRRVGEALVTSTLIMVCSFCVVLLSNVPSTREFALVFMIVLCWALVGDLLFLPALLAMRRDSGKVPSRSGSKNH
ncbi:MAG: MMPL family transporter [Planctomycetales bacterium]|nr:MMPL family transporter [Planctomycetales bacterium]